jgi:hypothetical protein
MTICGMDPYDGISFQESHKGILFLYYNTHHYHLHHHCHNLSQIIEHGMSNKFGFVEVYRDLISRKTRTSDITHKAYFPIPYISKGHIILYYTVIEIQ